MNQLALRSGFDAGPFSASIPLSALNDAVFADLTGVNDFEYKFGQYNRANEQVFIASNDHFSYNNELNINHIFVSAFEEIIEDKLQKRLSMIDEYAKNNPGENISHYILSLFPELTAVHKNQTIEVLIPTEPPQSWSQTALDLNSPGRRVKENPAEFIGRVYEKWLGKGLTRADIRRLDPALYTALANWLQRNQMPENLKLPTLKQQNDEWVERIKANGAFSMPSDGASIARLGMAMRRRADDRGETNESTR